MAERWLPVVGYEGRYEVSDRGRVRSVARPGCRTPRLRRPYRNPEGYLKVQLHKDCAVKTLAVHRLVLTAFCGPCPEGMQGCHNDGDKSNNRLSNLRWDTPSANTLDQVLHGVHNMASKLRCHAGHPLDDANTYLAGARRQCRTCKAETQRRKTLRNSPVIPTLGLSHAELRAWAHNNGVACTVRGAVPRAVVEQYLEAS